MRRLTSVPFPTPDGPAKTIGGGPLTSESDAK